MSDYPKCTCGRYALDWRDHDPDCEVFKFFVEQRKKFGLHEEPDDTEDDE